MGLVFFKINKHKSFNYKPVFYDPNKEDSDTLTGKEGEENNSDLERLKSKIQKQWYAPKKSKPQKYAASKIALILAVLFAIAYLLLK